jgi:hypothetical protein
MEPLCRLQRIKLGTEINLPCLPIKIAKVMEIIKNITAEEISGRLNKSEDPNDPYSADETEARTWSLPEDFWDVLKDPLWKEWIEAIRKEMKGFEDNEGFGALKTTQLEIEVVIDDSRGRSRSQVVRGEALSRSVSARSSERAGRRFSWKCLMSLRVRPHFGGPQ